MILNKSSSKGFKFVAGRYKAILWLTVWSHIVKEEIALKVTGVNLFSHLEFSRDVLISFHNRVSDCFGRV